MHWGDMMYGAGFLWFFWILVLAGIAVLVVWIVRQGRTHETRGREEALDILKRRYAAGEIGREEFEQKKKDLTS